MENARIEWLKTKCQFATVLEQAEAKKLEAIAKVLAAERESKVASRYAMTRYALLQVITRNHRVQVER